MKLREAREGPPVPRMWSSRCSVRLTAVTPHSAFSPPSTAEKVALVLIFAVKSPGVSTLCRVQLCVWAPEVVQYLSDTPPLCCSISKRPRSQYNNSLQEARREADRLYVDVHLPKREGTTRMWRLSSHLHVLMEHVLFSRFCRPRCVSVSIPPQLRWRPAAIAQTTNKPA